MAGRKRRPEARDDVAAAKKSDDPIAIRFQLARKAAGLSFRKAEAQSKVSSPMICRIERGADVGLRTAIQLANAYGVSLDWLAGRGNRKPGS